MTMYKIDVTVPEDSADELREAIGRAGGGKVVDYSFCSYLVKGIGRFKAEQDADPAVGKVGELTLVVEENIQTTSDETHIGAVIKAIKDTHPYEEPVINVVKLEDLSEF